MNHYLGQLQLIIKYYNKKYTYNLIFEWMIMHIFTQ